jgi:ABC-2 type transport system ATP-binding protein
METSVSTQALRREFGKVTAVSDLNLDLPRGGVIGLVGPNGSGKSTAIRMLLGLIRPTSGTAEVLGVSIEDPSGYVARVGALIENPAFIPTLSAQGNLRSLARLRGLPNDRVDQVLEIVGLKGREKDAVKTFSLGMKQRLGIAAALLPDPELLILDEPTNGLDPAGIVEIRALLRRLASEDRTVIVSSHLLAEIEAACDYIVVIRFGELMFSGPIGELMSQASPHVDMRPEHEYDRPKLIALLHGAGYEVSDLGSDVRIIGEPSAAASANRMAASAGITLASIVVVQETLESVFLKMTGESDAALAQDRALAGKEVA